MDFYIGKPYSLRDYNCWSHAVKVRSDNGIKTKNFAVNNMSQVPSVIEGEILKANHGLVKVDSLNDLDIIIVHKNGSKRPLYHCGIYYKGNVSHCSYGLGQVVFETYQEFIAGQDGVTFWR